MEWKMEIVEGRVVVRAVDNGLGFSRPMLIKIDGVSVGLLEGESTRKSGGGLGLFQINEIVKLMGGELQIGNRRDFDMEGRGAVVEMSWPIDKSE
jgi:nitrogen fixation/metabolism regulation signal transduction histidine kinase